ncbi:hypothetical protein HYALB_00002713 [Hymenoscyphus albidus]|uniref:Developmental regulator protein n=1 Tax=Hymenoscyphus albidus TaxID=595503 RepID=A0A9N9M306_9HELO|nr:hypothetical protein HYALB_00002713 [Hymenoscyphus albidus]
MPTYLVHGFRWNRYAIRIHIIQNDLEDAASEWIVAPATSVELLNSFYSLYDFLPPSSPPTGTYPPVESPKSDEPIPTTPRFLSRPHTRSHSSLSFRSAKAIDHVRKLSQSSSGSNNNKIPQSPPRSRSSTSNSTTSLSLSTSTLHRKTEVPFNTWSSVKLLEEYNPSDLSFNSAPHAYVGDYMVRIDLGVSIAEEVNKYEAMRRAEAIRVNGDTGLSPREVRKKSRQLGWIENLRDGLQQGGELGWFVVVCGDEERSFESEREESISEESEEEMVVPTTRSSGFKSFFGRKSSRKNGALVDGY